MDASKVLKPDVFKNVDLIPSHLDLFTIDLDLAGETARETKLRRAIQPIASKYQVIVCDCPPNLTIPTQNALAMSSHFVVPVSPDFLSSIGIALLLTRVKKLCVDLEHDLEHSGVVISRVRRPSRHREVTAATLRAQFGASVFAAEIRERSAVSESAEKHLPIFDHGDRDASVEFTAVSDELLKRMDLIK